MIIMDKDARLLLVDDHWGVGACNRLAEVFPLYNDKNEEITGEDLADLKSERWCETWDWLESFGINVRADDDSLWSVQWDDGCLWAVHPDAEWDDDSETWVRED